MPRPPKRQEIEIDPHGCNQRSADGLLALLKEVHPEKDDPGTQVFVVDIPKFLPRRMAR